MIATPRLRRRALFRAAIVAWLCAFVSGCAARQIYYVRGCDERLAMAYKRMECRVCVTRPRPHEYLPDNPDGSRCVMR
jgi:hypothetical protein